MAANGAAVGCGRTIAWVFVAVLWRRLWMHGAQGYPLRETVVRARLATWTDISDALRKRLRNLEAWLCSLGIELLHETSSADSKKRSVRRSGV